MEEEKTDSKKMASGVVLAPEDRDPVMEKIAAALMQIFAKTTPRRSPLRRVGWRWWDALQGVEPVFEVSDIESFEDWFDDYLRELEAKDTDKKSSDVGQAIERGGWL